MLGLLDPDGPLLGAGVQELGMSLLLAAHLLCVNVAAGGPLVAAWLDWRGRRDEAAGRAAKWLAGWSLIGFLAGAVLGLAIGWLKWDADYRALWTGPLSYKLHWAGIEAIFSLVLMIGWWIWLPGKTRAGAVAACVRVALAVLASTNLLYHFPILFSVAARLDDTGQTAGERIGSAAFRQLMVIGEAPAMAVHVTLASVAVAATMLLSLSLRWRRTGDEAGAYKIAIWGGRWALVASVLQLPVGLWTLIMLTPAAQGRIMSGSGLGMALFLLSLVAALWLIRELVNVALGDGTRPALVRAMALMLATVVLMTAMQQHTRVSHQPEPHSLRNASEVEQRFPEANAPPAN
jgi:hypothetical protein